MEGADNFLKSKLEGKQIRGKIFAMEKTFKIVSWPQLVLFFLAFFYIYVEWKYFLASESETVYYMAFYRKTYQYNSFTNYSVFLLILITSLRFTTPPDMISSCLFSS